VGALFHKGDGCAVFVAEEGRAVKRTVALAGRNAAEAAVADGLEPGARVIVYPSDLLRDGVRLQSRR
jgi:HlyD family secretion protein